MSERPIRFTLDIDATAFIRAMRRASAAVARFSEALRAGQRREHWERHHPMPLRIDGHAYHQRRRNRRKR